MSHIYQTIISDQSSMFSSPTFRLYCKIWSMKKLAWLQNDENISLESREHQQIV